MSKTYTPGLPPDVLQRLEAYADQFRPDFARTHQAAWAHVYLHGLLIDGERKSIEPLSRRVALPAGLNVADPEQALQNFVNQAAWGEHAVWKR
jgi:SRSO17 transposase